MYSIILALVFIVLVINTILAINNKDKIGIIIHTVTIIGYILFILKYLEGGL